MSVRKMRMTSSVWIEEGEKEKDEQKKKTWREMRRKGSYGRGEKRRCSEGRGGEEKVRQGIGGKDLELA